MTVPKREYPASWHGAGYIWPDLFTGPWVVTVGFREIAGRMEPVGLQVQEKEPERAGDASEPSHVLTAEMIRRIPFGEFVARGRVNAAASSRFVARLLRDEGRPDEAEYLEGDARRFEARPGRPPRLNDDHYRRVADSYTAAWLGGTSPTRDVAERFHVAHPTAARWIHECRNRGLLPPTEKGKPSGNLPREEREGK